MGGERESEGSGEGDGKVEAGRRDRREKRKLRKKDIKKISGNTRQ